MDWIDVTKDRNKLWALVNILGSVKYGEFLD